MKNIFVNVLTASFLSITAFSSTADNESYTPLGLRMGSFMLFPSLELENDWNDNIYYRPANSNQEVSDFILHVRPGLKIRSNWSQHSLNLSAGSDAMFYGSHSNEDRVSYFADLDGRFDVLKDSFATGKIYYRDAQENRGSPEPIANRSIHPLENETLGATVGYEHKFNRLRFNISHDIHHINYQDGTDPSGDVVPNSQRNRYENTTDVRIGYELASGYEAYIRGSYNFIDYENVFAQQNNLDRSSQGYAIVAGATADITHTLVADAYVGYRNQDYNSAQLGSISGASGGFALTWMPTRLTSVTAAVDRNIMETTQANLSGFFSTMFTASVQHKLLRNVLLDVHGGYTFNDYSGSNPVNRQEDIYNAGFYAKYLVNRNFYVQAGYDHFSRSVNLNSADYEINNVYVLLGTQF